MSNLLLRYSDFSKSLTIHPYFSKPPFFGKEGFSKHVAGVLGFEPRMGDSESPALPLGDTPIYFQPGDFIKTL